MIPPTLWCFMESLFCRGSAGAVCGEIQFQKPGRDRLADDRLPVNVIKLKGFRHGTEENDVHALDIPQFHGNLRSVQGIAAEVGSMPSGFRKWA